jgi:hypothetical protein
MKSEELICSQGGSWRNIAITLLDPIIAVASCVRETHQQGSCHTARHSSEQKDWRKGGGGADYVAVVHLRHS